MVVVVLLETSANFIYCIIHKSMQIICKCPYVEHDDMSSDNVRCISMAWFNSGSPSPTNYTNSPMYSWIFISSNDAQMIDK